MAAKQKSRAKKRQQRKAARFLILLLLIVALTIAILFVTPIFNIKSITMSSTKIVSIEDVNSAIGDMIGQNIFSTWSSTICERLKAIPYVEDAKIHKSFFPPTLYVEITECQTAAYFEADGKQIIINSDLKVLDDSNTFPIDELPLIRGVEIKKYSVGKRLQLDDDEKLEALSVFLKTMTKTEQLGDVLYFDLTSITDLKFNYKGQLDVTCGSALELDKKLRMFKAVMTSGSLNDDVRGTIDLTNPEKAIHTP